jgi:hypothetical protein
LQADRARPLSTHRSTERRGSRTHEIGYGRRQVLAPIIRRRCQYMKFLKTHLRTCSDPEMCLLRRCSIVATRILQWSTRRSPRMLFGRSTCMHSRVRCTLYIALSGSTGVKRSRSRIAGVSMQGETKAERRISGLTIPWLSSFRLVEAFLFHVETFLPFPRPPHLIRLHYACNTPLVLPDGCDCRKFGTCLFGR